MEDTDKTKKQLITELQEARRGLELLNGGTAEQKPGKAEFKQTEDKFYKAFLSSPDMIIITSIPDGKYIEVNEAYARNTGYSREELIGKSIHDYNFFASPAEEQRMVYLLEKQGHFKSEEFTFRVRSGEIQQWLCSAEVVSINKENCMIAVAIDITERKKVEQALNESEQILAIAFHSGPQAIAITTVEDGKFIELNHSYEILSGYSREELIGHSATGLKIWPDMEERKRVFHLLNTRGHLTDEIVTIKDKSGAMHLVLFSADIIKIRGEICMIGSAADITEREEISRALRASEEKFSRAFNSSLTAMCLFGVEDSRFLEVNDSFTHFTGYSREEVIGRTPDELGLWVDKQEMIDMSEKLQKTGSILNQRIHSRKKSGEIRTGLFSAQTFEINGKPHMILSVNDITDQAKAAEAIANEATLRRVLIQNSRDGIVVLDDTGKVFEANLRFCEMLGYTPEEIKDLYVWDWDRWDSENLLKMIRSISDTGDNFEIKQKRKDGSLMDVELSLNGVTIAGEKLVFCVCRDITLRKQMEKALRESEEKFSKAFHSGPEIAAITTLKDGRYIDVNGNYLLSTGYTREELIGHPARSLGIWVKPEERLDMLKTIENEGKVSKKEYSFYNKSGQIRTWLFSAEQVTIGDEPCLLCISIDITDQKLTEARAQEAENLREIDKLRRELLANVSHELRTPLASIKGFTTMLMDYGKRLKPYEKQEYLETIDKNADRLVELIEQLLEMSRLGAGMLAIHKQRTNISELCHNVVKEANVRSPGYIFRLDMPKRLPRIEIDERRIRQVLDNLIDNSVKYSDTGTEITISVRKKDNDMLFSVADHGSGISEKDIPHVFERMFSVQSTKNPGITGAGLGLSICKGLIEAHDGKIWFESEEGVGTRCFFTLPVKSKPADDAADNGEKTAH